MAIHELGTNAVKYGALSKSAGKVDIRWNIQSEEDGEYLVLEWKETGGPAATAPDETGFGTQILDQFLVSSLNGKTTLTYGEDGFCWSLKAPLEQFTGSADPDGD